MFYKVSAFLALTVAVAARPDDNHGSSYPSIPVHPTPSHSIPRPSYNAPHHPAPTYADVPPQYNAQYAVNDEYSGNNFGHQEDRDGYNTQGTYYVQLPDGRLQKVTYYVDGESGYVAEVTYEGEAQYPSYQPAPSQSYQPAPSQSYQPAPSPSYA